MGQDANMKAHLHQGKITLELLSFSDGKEGAAKAANILCTEYLKGKNEASDETRTSVFTENDIAHALKIAGIFIILLLYDILFIALSLFF